MGRKKTARPWIQYSTLAAADRAATGACASCGLSHPRCRGRQARPPRAYRNRGRCLPPRGRSDSVVTMHAAPDRRKGQAPPAGSAAGPAADTPTTRCGPCRPRTRAPCAQTHPRPGASAPAQPGTHPRRQTARHPACRHRPTGDACTFQQHTPVVQGRSGAPRTASAPPRPRARGGKRRRRQRTRGLTHGTTPRGGRGRRHGGATRPRPTWVGPTPTRLP
ncbi:hypothetical protein BU14_0118s0009 [Porphyra umbilicalis]|uniref:Uncharacterized protein n=1 Tax=Porphyra umbilicalis TaxID=2786 RepID=A0A1X6PBC3_PORUM|nr:hypothetical protein BU14_0118s0009 [Porphyra umbilicalis]|eukprot:OSX78158.1 hypothetical protein BU14_0118s0009 [Porphyra umbilicalis]